MNRYLMLDVLLGVALLGGGCGSNASPTGSSSVPTTPPSSSQGGTQNVSASPPDAAIQGVTVVTFTVTQASGLSYTWDFGDGGSATGSLVTHVFNNPGQFTVALKASDGTSGQTAMTVKSLSGSWADVESPGQFQWTLVQSGFALTGTDTTDGASLQGAVSSPRTVSVRDGGVALLGRVEKGLDGMALTYTTPAGPKEIRLIRQ
jgi:hypothetical protein